MRFTLDFVSGLGPVFLVLFLLLTALSIYWMAAARDHARATRAAADALMNGTAGGPTPLLDHLAAMQTAGGRARMALSSIPSVGLLGTTVGMYVALTALGAADLGGGDSLALLDTLMDNGVSAALATTVAAQALYFLLGQIWSTALSAPLAEARVHADEALARVREPVPSPRPMQAVR